MIINETQVEQILSLCRDHIQRKGNVRIGWAVNQVLGRDRKDKVDYHHLDKISSLLIRNGQYVRGHSNPNFEYDWDISINPEYELAKKVADSTVTLNNLQRNYIIVSTILAIWLCILTCNQVSTGQRQTEMQEQSIQMQQRQRHEDSLRWVFDQKQANNKATPTHKDTTSKRP